MHAELNGTRQAMPVISPRDTSECSTVGCPKQRMSEVSVTPCESTVESAVEGEDEDKLEDAMPDRLAGTFPH